MAVITISRGTFTGGQSLAESAAEKLGYRCISRQVLVEAARDYGVPLEKLSNALEEAPGFLERLTTERAHYLAYIRATLCREVKDDGVVYHGHAGHLLLKGLPHVLRIRVIAGMEFRIRGAMERRQLSREKAIQFIKKMDDKRAKWTRFLYQVDWNDSSLYDLVINIDHMSVLGACDIVCRAVTLGEFKTTPEARETMDDLLLSTELRAAVAANKGIADAGVEIEADRGVVTIGGTVRSLEDADMIREMLRTMPGVKEIKSEMRVGPHW